MKSVIGIDFPEYDLKDRNSVAGYLRFITGLSCIKAEKVSFTATKSNQGNNWRRMENGQKPVRDQSLFLLCDAIGLDFSNFVENKEEYFDRVNLIEEARNHYEQLVGLKKIPTEIVAHTETRDFNEYILSVEDKISIKNNLYLQFNMSLNTTIYDSILEKYPIEDDEDVETSDNERVCDLLQMIERMCWEDFTDHIDVDISFLYEDQEGDEVEVEIAGEYPFVNIGDCYENCLKAEKEFLNSIEICSVKGFEKFIENKLFSQEVYADSQEYIIKEFFKLMTPEDSILRKHGVLSKLIEKD